MSSSKENKYEEVLELIVCGVFILAMIFYVIRKVIKCFFVCKKDSKGRRTSRFSFGFRGDTPSDSPLSSPEHETNFAGKDAEEEPIMNV
jgi:hypothetical protein